MRHFLQSVGVTPDHRPVVMSSEYDERGKILSFNLHPINPFGVIGEAMSQAEAPYKKAMEQEIGEIIKDALDNGTL